MSVISLAEYKQTQNILAKYNDLLSVGDLTELFGVSKQTIYKEMKSGKFGKLLQIGRAYKIPKVNIIKRYFFDM